MIPDCSLMKRYNTNRGRFFESARFHIVTYVYMLLRIVLKNRSKISVAADALIAFLFGCKSQFFFQVVIDRPVLLTDIIAGIG